MPTVLLVRHGRTAANASGVLAGWTPGVGLDETGQAQAKTLAGRLENVPIRLAVASPLQRCQETASALLESGPDRPALLTDARTKSDQLISEAQLKAGTLEADARRNHSEAMNSLVDKRAAMLEEISKLGNLAQSYQTALDTHLARQLQELDSVDKLPTGQDFG